MAFKVKRFIPDPSPINLVDPGKVLKTIGATIFPVANTVVDAVKGVSKTVKAYKARNYKDPVDNKPKVKVKSQVTKDGEAGYKADDRARKNKTGIYAPKKKKIKDRKPSTTNTETKASGKQSELSPTSLGKKGKQKKFGDEVTIQSTRNNKKSTPKENTLDAINKVSMKEFVPASKKTTTVKAAPKDNSRKAIKARKTADKKAGVSKSQMRANKAKSKSEKALAKSKATKDSVNKAHLKSKSERLAKRAKRKGGSPVKATSGPGDGVKMRTDAEILKQYPGAVKVKGKLNEFKYKGTTLNPSRYPVSDKGKTVKQAIKIKNKK